MENYEQLLEEAYLNVKQAECNGRFGIRGVEGHIEGNKTIISNFMQIANCLRRKPEHLAKFLFKELASSGEIVGERLVLTRKVSSQKINEKIQRYVNLFVICPNCKKPDTELIDSEGKRFIRCLACGIRKQVVNKF